MIWVGRQGRWGAVGCLQDPEIGRGRTTAPAGERRGARGRSRSVSSTRWPDRPETACGAARSRYLSKPCSTTHSGGSASTPILPQDRQTPRLLNAAEVGE